MRVSLNSYMQGQGAKVFSLVVGVPFAPLDIDLGHLARGEWNAAVDRFRVWHLPGEGGDEPVCYVMVRKFDPKDGVLVCGHVVVNLPGSISAKNGWSFTVGILSNDEVKARAMLNSLLDIPPSFHRRSELKVIERRWRSDPEAVVRFLANVHSSMTNLAPDPDGKVYALKFEPPPGMMEELKRGMGAWWRQ
ncbi:MAG TPA: hypothetical protein VJR06_07565 [Nitrososphaerales archaeon]|nr:hypothetical protein [Nitrososphaerales archaeon]